MDLPFNKCIADSRHAHAGNNNSCETSLPETLALPHNAVCYVCDLQVTNTFSSVDPSRNVFYRLENEGSQNVINRVFDQQIVYSGHPGNGTTDKTQRIVDTSPQSWVHSSF